ncbi:MAG: hypothetical protein K6G55_05610 [Selenomonadaceae bacterium]|nr:hypothetical protein [Selenomonadaceae bacterium]
MKVLRYVLIVLVMLTATAQAAEPVRIARLPIIFQTRIPDEKSIMGMETRIERATHIPLNGYLQVAEYISPEESTAALEKIWSPMSTNKKAKLSEAMRPLAEELNADIIICPILRDYMQVVIPSFNSFGETYMSSRAAVELIVYDRRTDTLLDEKASRGHYDTFDSMGTANYLARICFDKVIAKTKLRELISAIGK